MRQGLRHSSTLSASPAQHQVQLNSQNQKLASRQQRRLSPEQQQALRLLSLSAADLRHELGHWIEDNPFLSLEPEPEQDQALDADAQDSLNQTPKILSKPPELVPIRRGGLGWLPSFSASTMAKAETKTDSAADPISQLAAPSTQLSESLRLQIATTPMSDLMRALASQLIDALDSNGYLQSGSLKALAQSLPSDSPEKRARNHQLAEKALAMLQNCSPTGVGARDLKECLLLQLKERCLSTAEDKPRLALAIKLVRSALHLLAYDPNTILAKLAKLATHAQSPELSKLTLDELNQELAEIKHCYPYPVDALEQELHQSDHSVEFDYVYADLLLQESAHGWTVVLNPATVPKLDLDDSLHATLSATTNAQRSKHTAMNTAYQQAKWLMTQIHRRQTTLLEVANAVIEHQQAYFQEGEAALKPLKLDDLAQKLDLHSSTISRSLQDKYLQLPAALGARVIAMKTLFSKALVSSTGDQVSSAAAIAAKIRALIDTEPNSQPLSDQHIAEVLTDQGLSVARRTVSKYRQRLNIPASSQRKRVRGTI